MKLCKDCENFIRHYANTGNGLKEVDCGHCGRYKTILPKKLFGTGCDFYKQKPLDSAANTM